MPPIGAVNLRYSVLSDSHLTATNWTVNGILSPAGRPVPSQLFSSLSVLGGRHPSETPKLLELGRFGWYALRFVSLSLSYSVIQVLPGCRQLGVLCRQPVISQWWSVGRGMDGQRWLAGWQWTWYGWPAVVGWLAFSGMLGRRGGQRAKRCPRKSCIKLLQGVGKEITGPHLTKTPVISW